MLRRKEEELMLQKFLFGLSTTENHDHIDEKEMTTFEKKILVRQVYLCIIFLLLVSN